MEKPREVQTPRPQSFRFSIPNISFVKSKEVFCPSILTNLPSDRKAVCADAVKLASKVFASVRLAIKLSMDSQAISTCLS